MSMGLLTPETWLGIHRLARTGYLKCTYGIGRVVFVGVTPCVSKIDFPCIRLYVCKGVEHMCELVGWEILRVVVSPVNSPVVRLARLCAPHALGIGRACQLTK